MIKKCLYCSEDINTKEDDFEKRGKKYICAFCYEENAEEFELLDAADEDED